MEKIVFVTMRCPNLRYTQSFPVDTLLTLDEAMRSIATLAGSLQRLTGDGWDVSLQKADPVTGPDPRD